MSAPAPTFPAPGWYPATRNVLRWWDGRMWTENAMVSGKPTTITVVRHRYRAMLWATLAVGALMWIIFIVSAMSGGTSVALLMAWTPVIGLASMIAGPVVASRALAKLPPTQGVPG